MHHLRPQNFFLAAFFCFAIGPHILSVNNVFSSTLGNLASSLHLVPNNTCPSDFWKHTTFSANDEFPCQVDQEGESPLTNLGVLQKRDDKDVTYALASNLMIARIQASGQHSPRMWLAVDEAGAFLVNQPVGSNPQGEDLEEARALNEILDRYIQ